MRQTFTLSLECQRVHPRHDVLFRFSDSRQWAVVGNGNGSGSHRRQSLGATEKLADNRMYGCEGPPAHSRAESFRGPSLCFCCFSVSVLRRRMRLERTEKARRDACDIIHCSQEQSFVRLRRFVKAAYFSDELKRSSSNFLGSYWRLEVKERLDIPAHLTAIVWLQTTLSSPRKN
jgi:hypothetical protein